MENMETKSMEEYKQSFIYIGLLNDHSKVWQTLQKLLIICFQSYDSHTLPPHPQGHVVAF